MSEYNPAAEAVRRDEMLDTLREAISSGEPLEITLRDDHDGIAVGVYLRDLYAEDEVEFSNQVGLMLTVLAQHSDWQDDEDRTFVFNFIAPFSKAEKVCDKIFEGTESLELDE